MGYRKTKGRGTVHAEQMVCAKSPEMWNNMEKGCTKLTITNTYGLLGGRWGWVRRSPAAGHTEMPGFLLRWGGDTEWFWKEEWHIQAHSLRRLSVKRGQGDQTQRLSQEDPGEMARVWVKVGPLWTERTSQYWWAENETFIPTLVTMYYQKDPN